jgi:hypothetical protein
LKIRSILIAALLSATIWGFLNIVSLTADAAVVPKNAIKGSLFGIQNDKTGNPTWLVGGVFRVDNVKTTPIFNATFYMMKLDGTATHTHTVSNFKLIGNPNVNGNSTTFNGTSTITMMNSPLNNVPTSIKLFDDSAVRIWFDPSITNNHFGNTPIYGTQHVLKNPNTVSSD